jgi:hypothetical protein
MAVYCDVRLADIDLDFGNMVCRQSHVIIDQKLKHTLGKITNMY